MNKCNFYLNALKNKKSLLTGIYYYYFRIEFLFLFIELLENEGGKINIFPSLSNNFNKDESFNIIIIEYDGNNISDLIKKYNSYILENELGEALIKLKIIKNNKLLIKLVKYKLKEEIQYFEDKYLIRTGT